jgi:hypothetical protein
MSRLFPILPFSIFFARKKVGISLVEERIHLHLSIAPQENPDMDKGTALRRETTASGILSLEHDSPGPVPYRCPKMGRLHLKDMPIQFRCALQAP